LPNRHWWLGETRNYLGVLRTPLRQAPKLPEAE
jgi:hypothetical protein